MRYNRYCKRGNHYFKTNNKGKNICDIHSKQVERSKKIMENKIHRLNKQLIETKEQVKLIRKDIKYYKKKMERAEF